jgi:hypothetical protein
MDAPMTPQCCSLDAFDIALMARFLLKRYVRSGTPTGATSQIGGRAMVAIIVQLAVVGMWATTLIIHTRRLLRLAQLETLEVWQGKRLRGKLMRVWWWLGRDEYWRAVQVDGARCIQMTLMIFLMAWGTYV